MTRPIRVEYEGAVYHVAARGNEGRAIFRDDGDREVFLATGGEACRRFGTVIHAYCLMPNHYHAVLETPRGNLSRAMGWLQTTYTIRFNRQHRRGGHVVQGLLDRREGQEEIRWRTRADAQAVRKRVAPMVRHEPDPRIRIWMRVQLGGEPAADLARELGYADGSGVLRVVQRLEANARQHPRLAAKLHSAREEIKLS